MKHGGVIVKGVCVLLAFVLSSCSTTPTQRAPVKTDYIAFDIETTGLSSKKDRIIEIGVASVSKGRVIDSRSWLINPGLDIPERSTRVHGITDDMVADAEAFGVIFNKFQTYVGAYPLAAHNASFEKRFLEAECERSGCPRPPNQIIDTLALFRKIYPNRESYRLSALSADMKVNTAPNHRGEQDAYALAELLIKSRILDANALLKTQAP